MTLPCIELEPREPCTSSVIWLHGLGADGSDFAPIAPMFGLHSTRFVFPHAPHQPVTINGGYVMRSWYDILTMDRGPERESEPDIRASAREVEALIQRERDRGVPSSRIVLAGFSQGGAMALHVGIRYPETLAGIVVLSAYQVLADTVEREASAANSQTPLFFAHGTRDEVVPTFAGQEAAARYGTRATWLTYPMGHEVHPQEIADIKAWMHARLGAA